MIVINDNDLPFCKDHAVAAGKGFWKMRGGARLFSELDMKTISSQRCPRGERGARIGVFSVDAKKPVPGKRPEWGAD